MITLTIICCDHIQFYIVFGAWISSFATTEIHSQPQGFIHICNMYAYFIYILLSCYKQWTKCDYFGNNKLRSENYDNWIAQCSCAMFQNHLHTHFTMKVCLYFNLANVHSFDEVCFVTASYIFAQKTIALLKNLPNNWANAHYHSCFYISIPSTHCVGRSSNSQIGI